MKNYFQPWELQCPCCKQGTIRPELLKILNQARGDFGRAIVLNSAYRCPRHNIKVLGSSMYSSHMDGWAVDIRARSDATKYELMEILMRLGVSRFGVRKTFLHIDIDPDKNPKRIWGY